MFVIIVGISSILYFFSANYDSRIKIENNLLGINSKNDNFLCDSTFKTGYTTANTPSDNIENSYLTQTYDVIVIGAGISGLEAAHQLDKNGVNVMILEGRDRIGGRVWTVDIDNTAIDLGASWIHGLNQYSGFQNPLFLITERNNIITVKTSDTSTLYNYIGKKIDDDTSEIFDRYVKFAQKYDETLTDEQKQKISVQDVINKFYLKGSLDARQRAIFNYTMQFNYDMGQAENTTNISFAKSLETQYFAEDEDHEVIFPQGYGQIANCLAGKLNILHANVTKVDYTGSPITIYTNQGIFHATHVISTLPISILQNKTNMKVEFVPNFDQTKMDAINSLAMGTMDKVYLLYDKPFWDSSTWINRVSENNNVTDKKWQFFFNLYKYDDKPIILAFNTGESAKQLEMKSNYEIKNELVNILEKIYPGKHEPINYVVTRWASDPLAGGSYSIVPINGSVNSADILAKPINDKLFFAGEATSKYYYGTVHAAYISGYRAAEEVLKAKDEKLLDAPLEQLRHGIKKWDVICKANEQLIVDESSDDNMVYKK
ncbi:MAG: FAD-dependent oxidoreductase [Nitrosopumilus sp.]|nr:FAD-dependent oxidoreductase [Nitrosopumilus sp.]